MQEKCLTMQQSPSGSHFPINVLSDLTFLKCSHLPMRQQSSGRAEAESGRDVGSQSLCVGPLICPGTQAVLRKAELLAQLINWGDRTLNEVRKHLHWT